MLIIPLVSVKNPFGSTMNNKYRVGLRECELQTKFNFWPQAGSAPKYLDHEGSDPEAHPLTHDDDGLLWLGADPRVTGLQDQAEEQAEHEASIVDLKFSAAEVSKQQQVCEAAMALSMGQAQEKAEDQMAPVRTSGGARRPTVPQVGPRYAEVLARLSGQARANGARC